MLYKSLVFLKLSHSMWPINQLDFKKNVTFVFSY